MFQNIVIHPHRHRLNSERALADTTAETHASVKGEHHIAHFRNASAASGHSGLRSAAGSRHRPGLGARAPQIRRRFLRADNTPCRMENWTRPRKLFARCCRSIRQSGAAYTNLGVVYMRRKQWAKAVSTLEKAERLMPETAGVRLNIGLGLLPAE